MVKIKIGNEEMTGGIWKKPTDMPKVEGAPSPVEPGVFTVYIDNGTMRARFHAHNDFNKFSFDGAIDNPENFVEVCLAWKAR